MSILLVIHDLNERFDEHLFFKNGEGEIITIDNIQEYQDRPANFQLSKILRAHIRVEDIEDRWDAIFVIFISWINLEDTYIDYKVYWDGLKYKVHF